MKEKIGEQLQKIREDHGLTQEQIAVLSGVNRSTIAKIENGKFNVSVDLLGKIIKPLGLELIIHETKENKI